MNPRETLTMSQKEAPRAGLLKALVAGRVTGAEVAAALHLSDRQVRRLRRRFETEGAEGLLHRSRGRPSRRRLARRVRQRVALLLRTTYRDFNDCHATEKLQEVEGLAISRATVHRWRRALGRPAKHRRRPRCDRRECRAAHRGALLREDQIIGSLSFNRKAPGEFPPEVVDVLKTFATQSALAIQNARLFREIADKSAQLEAASR